MGNGLIIIIYIIFGNGHNLVYKILLVKQTADYVTVYSPTNNKYLSITSNDYLIFKKSQVFKHLTLCIRDINRCAPRAGFITRWLISDVTHLLWMTVLSVGDIDYWNSYQSTDHCHSDKQQSSDQ